MTYDNYIQTHKLLKLQIPLSEGKCKVDELLFITIHQNSELLMKVLHEYLDCIDEYILSCNDLMIIKTLDKIIELMNSLNSVLLLSFQVEKRCFDELRKNVYPASAIESEQFKCFFHRISYSKNSTWVKLYTYLKNNSKMKIKIIEKISLLKNSVELWRSNHLDIAYHFLRNEYGSQSEGVVFLKERNGIEIFSKLKKI